MSAFGGAVKNCWVLGWFDFDDPILFGSNIKFGHAVGAGEMCLPWDCVGVCYNGRLVK